MRLVSRRRGGGSVVPPATPTPDAGIQVCGEGDLRRSVAAGAAPRSCAVRRQQSAKLRDRSSAATVRPAPTADRHSRPAILGLARVARSQNRLDEARGLYERLLAVNPKDPDALDGLAWLALAERNREQAQAGFKQVLAIAPDNEEATVGLSQA